MRIIPADSSISKLNNGNIAVMVIVNTNLGSFTIELFSKQAPLSCEYFSKLVHDGFYNNTIIHQVIRDFAIQAGRFDTKEAQKSSDHMINSETSAHLSHQQGTVALARARAPNSCNHEFFINTGDNSFLNNNRVCQFTVIGRILMGMEVVNSINQVKTTPNTRGLLSPLQTIKIVSMENQTSRS